MMRFNVIIMANKNVFNYFFASLIDNFSYVSEMSIAAEKLPLPRRDVRKKKLPRRCRDATAYKKILPRRDGL